MLNKTMKTIDLSLSMNPKSAKCSCILYDQERIIKESSIGIKTCTYCKKEISEDYVITKLRKHVK